MRRQPPCPARCRWTGARGAPTSPGPSQGRARQDAFLRAAQDRPAHRPRRHRRRRHPALGHGAASRLVAHRDLGQPRARRCAGDPDHRRRPPRMVGCGGRGRAPVAGHARPPGRTSGGDPAERIMLAASRPSGSLSWLLLVPPSGDEIAIQSLSDDALRVLRAGEGGEIRGRPDRAAARHPADAAEPPPKRLQARGTRAGSSRSGLGQPALGRRRAHAGWGQACRGLCRQDRPRRARGHDRL